MNTQVITLKTYIFGLFVAVLALVAAVPSAQAATYYYQTATPYYSYQQPIYHQYSSYNTTQLLAQLRSLQRQLEVLQNQYRLIYGHSYSGSSYYDRDQDRDRDRDRIYWGDDYDIEVDTLYARDVEGDEATLFGEVDFDDADYVDVWFEYGQDGDLDEESDEERLYSDDDDERFSIDVDDLDEDENYYFRAIAEAPGGDRAYGQIKSFTADDEDDDDDSNDEEPDVETNEADNVNDVSAELNGEVDMNDFDNGDVFFVWGEDEDLVEEVEDEDSYDDIDEDGDDLQKQNVFNGLDDQRSFWLMVYGLNDNTDHYFRICVEYEDEDDDEVLACGSVEHFETD